MKTKIAVFLAGLTLGMLGELAIPRKYWFGQTSGCLKDGPYVIMPRGYLYDSARHKYPLNLHLERGVIPSYRFLYSLLTGETKWLSSEECNKLVDLIKESESNE